MTKIDIASDIHLEFGDLLITNHSKSDILCLAGDICVMKQFDRLYKDWFLRVCDLYEDVIFIAGNHEFYKSSIEKTLDICRNINISNLHFLENDSVLIKDVKFIGATLWTDFNNHNPIDMYTTEQSMNDFKVIRYNRGVSRFTPNIAYNIHKDTLKYFDEELSKNKSDKTVVMTHHAPSYQSVDPKYKNSNINMAYCSSLEDFILKHKIDKWIHGHIHNKCRYHVANTEIICNPRGYVGYENTLVKNFELISIKI